MPSNNGCGDLLLALDNDEMCGKVKGPWRQWIHTLGMDMTVIDDTAIKLLFTGARAQNGWKSGIVTDAQT